MIRYTLPDIVKEQKIKIWKTWLTSIALTASLLAFALLLLINFSASTPICWNLEGNLNQVLRNGNHTDFSFIVFGDSKRIRSIEIFEGILKEIRKKRPLFAIVVGDFVKEGKELQYNWFLRTVEECKLQEVNTPLFTVIGNHELTPEGKKAVFQRYFGPSYYWFSYGNSLFIALDDADEKINEEQHQWMDRILKEKQSHFEHVFVFAHIPPFDCRKGKNHCLPEEEGKRFMKIMQKWKVDRVFCGNIHSYHRAIRKGVPYIITGGGGAILDEKNSFFHYIEVEVIGPKIKEKVVKIAGQYSFWDSLEYSFLVSFLSWFYPHPWLAFIYRFTLTVVFTLTVIIGGKFLAWKIKMVLAKISPKKGK